MKAAGRRALRLPGWAPASLAPAGCATPEILPKSGPPAAWSWWAAALAAPSPPSLRLFDPALEVILIERNPPPWPALQQPGDHRPDLEGLTLAEHSRYGVRLLFDEVTAIDPATTTVVTRSGRLRYDRAVGLRARHRFPHRA
ncbi:MAG: FAD/NAD(P)-binding oxidoreductase [Rhodocyclaceae bacterium]